MAARGSRPSRPADKNPMPPGDEMRASGSRPRSMCRERGGMGLRNLGNRGSARNTEHHFPSLKLIPPVQMRRPFFFSAQYFSVLHKPRYSKLFQNWHSTHSKLFQNWHFTHLWPNRVVGDRRRPRLLAAKKAKDDRRNRQNKGDEYERPKTENEKWGKAVE